jgi:spore coat polysaccharide biosynthesis protein SpsF
VPRVVASIEARMGSSRLPGKVMMDVAGKPAIERLVERLAAARLVDDMVLATSTAPADDALEAWATKYGLACHRGSEDDVLGRVVAAQQAMGGETVVEITGDCTLLCPEVIDLGIETFLAGECDVVSNTWKSGFPLGADVQVFPLGLLEEVAETVHDAAVREHVSLHFYEHPERYRIVHLEPPQRWRRPELRLQLDYPEDHAFISAVYTAVEPQLGPTFGLDAILDLLDARPEIASLNAHCEEKAPR